MRVFYITFRSVTYAQRGEKVLQKQGLRVSLQRTPRWMEEKGCGYCLRIWTGDAAGAVAVLREAGVPMRKVYAQLAEGQMEEVLL